MDTKTFDVSQEEQMENENQGGKRLTQKMAVKIERVCKWEDLFFEFSEMKLLVAWNPFSGPPPVDVVDVVSVALMSPAWPACAMPQYHAVTSTECNDADLWWAKWLYC